MGRKSGNLPAVEMPKLVPAPDSLRAGTIDRIARLRKELDGATHDELKRFWKRQFGRNAPAKLNRSLLYRALLYRLQVEVFGELPPQLGKALDAIAKGKDVSSTDLRRTGLSTGTILAREHDGVEQRVHVTDEGFSWHGHTYKSLSQVAYAITGTKWNGPRFFGLRHNDA